VEKYKGICQQPFCSIARKVQNSRLSFARSYTLAENTPFRSSQQTQSGETLGVMITAPHFRNTSALIDLNP
jgi:hypothetical protein